MDVSRMAVRFHGGLRVLAAMVTAAAIGCAASTASYPAAPGFHAAASDAGAVAIADRTMEAMGGYDAWASTRFVTWEFFGRRRHLWDKHTGDVRIDTTLRDGDEAVVVVNVNDGTGRAWINGAPVQDEQRLSELLDAAESWWINDSYWLVMPYKLKDSGVTLTSLGERAMEDGRPADVLQLTFEAVGRTPQNKYHVYVARDSGLVEQWDFFAEAADAEPRFSTPWQDWRRYGRIMLSGDRGSLRGNPARLTRIAVHDDVPAAAFASPLPWSPEG